MPRNENDLMKRARDELMSHVVRCNVLASEMPEREAWLEETMDYMKTRYPQLSELEVLKLSAIGAQFIKPPIPHGSDYGARARDEQIDELVEAELAAV